MKQVEFRLCVHYTKSERLLQCYRVDPNANFHQIVGEFVHRVRPDLDYTRIKMYNFLSLYGGGATAAARNLGISIAEATELSAIYHSEFPEARALLREVSDMARRRGYVKSLLGRRARFRDDQRWYRALNAIVQSSAADAMKLALVAVYLSVGASASRCG